MRMQHQGLALMMVAGTWMAALLGALAVLAPGSQALTCHQASSVLFYGPRGHVLDATVTPKTNQSCPPHTPACLAASATLRTGAMWVMATFWGCSEGVPGTTPPPGATLPPGATPLQRYVRLCSSDLCNDDLYKEPVPLDDPIFLGPNEGPAPHDATQCLSGLSPKPEPGVLERVTCPGEAQCYHGNGTIVAGELSVPLFVWSCQPQPCATAPIRRRVGPLLFTQEGACCSGSFCTGTAAAQQSHVTKEAMGSEGTPASVSASLAPKGGNRTTGWVTMATPVPREGDRKGNPGRVTTATPGPSNAKDLFMKPKDVGPTRKGVPQTSTFNFRSTRPARHPGDLGKQQGIPTKGPHAA
ncbi:ly6/PLAUR domain-containing protein 5-like, partial [Alligator sinensis]|uniref:Ly6/PLAUR domain-containing protein 5-like n=1 Tax=Alligator sinensis TaxID=38654 RepID=A0A3Q0HP34_ALLSI